MLEYLFITTFIASISAAVVAWRKAAHRRAELSNERIGQVALSYRKKDAA